MIMVKDDIPQIEHHMIGKLYKEVRKEDGKKSNKSYGLLNTMNKLYPIDKIADAMKIFGISREKAKKLVKGANICRKIKAFPTKTINTIRTFYCRDDISRVSPNTRETTKKYGTRRYMRFQFRVAYRIFKLENPETKVSFSKFHSLKPKNIRAVSKTPLISSLCCYCQNVSLKLQAMNCPGLSSEYQLFNQFTCKKEAGNILRKVECMKKTCKDCKHFGRKLREYVSERIDIRKEILYLSWKTKTFETNSGKKSVRRVLKSTRGTIEECLNELIKEDLESTLKRCNFFEHFYGQIYQIKMYKSCHKNLQPGEAMMIQDFSRNRDVFYQSEIKSSYWTRKQVTMHPTVIYFKDMEGSSHRRVLTHLSDVTLHNAHVVHYITKDCIEYLREHFPNIEWIKVIMWSDGCCSQYKGKHSFLYLNKLQNIFPEIKFQRNYFGSEHGKGESDAETGIFSRQIRDAVKSEASVLSNANQMCEFLIKNNKEDRVFRIFTEADLEPIYEDFRGVNVSTLEGKCTRSLHQIMPTNKKGLLKIRPFSCFCKSCILDKCDSCENISFTGGEYKSKKLPSKSRNVSCDDLNDSEYDEENDDDNLMDHEEFHNESDLPSELQIKQEEIHLSDLKPMDFVITSLEKRSKNQYFVAQIQEVDEENDTLVMNYLSQHKEHMDIFCKSEKYNENNCVGFAREIIMKLSDPQELRRGNKYFFTHRINLKNVNI